MHPHRGLVFLLVWFAAALGSSPALAHKLHVFAAAQGRAIEGEVYASDGTPIRNATVNVVGPTGEKLGQTTTDAQGKFRFEARQRVDHSFVLDDGAGHGAKYTVAADELPAELPAVLQAMGSPPGRSPREAPSVTHRSAAKPSAQAADEPLGEQLRALHAQIVQLRKQIDAYEQKIRLHDILGGLGVILGVTGVTFYFLGVRCREKTMQKDTCRMQNDEQPGEPEPEQPRP